MFALRLNAAAGPSMRALRAVPLSPIARAPLARASIPLPSPLASLRFASTAPAPTQRTTAPAPSIKGRLTAQQWPWYPIEPPRHAGQVEEERVIYARPGGVNPKIYWAMAILYSSGVIIYFVLPSPEEARQHRTFDGQEGAILGIPTGSFMSYLAGGAMTTFTVIAFLGLVFPSRMITRLSLIRSRPVGAPVSEAKQYLRMQHLGHGMMTGKRALPREIPVEDVTVKVILGRPTANGERERLSYLNLKVNSPRAHSKLAFDGYGYRLDFRKTPQLETEKGEVVLSLARLEDVFGPLDISNPIARPAAAAQAATKAARK